MRKLLVRLINLVYIAAAGASIYFLAKKPITYASINLDLTSEQVGEKLEPLLDGIEIGSDSEDDTSKSGNKKAKEFDAYINAEKIAGAFKDGFHLKIPFEIPAEKAFQFDNKKIISEIILDNFDRILTNSLDTLVPPLRKLILDVTEEFAKDALKDAINSQIQTYMGDDQEATTEQVLEIYNNVYEMLDSEGEVKVSDLTDVIINGKEKDDGTMTASALSILNEKPRYVKADPQPTNETEFAEKEYYVVGEDDSYVLATEFDSGATYYIVKPYDTEDIDIEKIEDMMTEALENIPGLVSKDFIVAPETGDELKAKVLADLKSDKYYIQVSETEYEFASEYDPGQQYYYEYYQPCDDSEAEKIAENPAYYCYYNDGKYIVAQEYIEGVQYYKYYKHFPCEPGTPTESEFNATIRCSQYFWLIDEETSTYTFATNWDSSKTYYTYEVYVNDLDTALTYLITTYLLGDGSGESSGGSRAIVRSTSLQSLKSNEELKKALKEFILSKINLDFLADFEIKYGQYVPYGLLAIIGIFALPWAWFALVSLIRTLRKKCWTRPGIILVWCIPQVLLGLIITYGTKHAIPIVANFFEPVKQFTDIISLDVRTGCLYPSFIYFGVFALSIVYWILTKPIKVEYKFNKILDRREKRQRQLARRNANRYGSSYYR